MNTASSFFNAIQLAQKPAAIGFISLFGLGIIAALASAISSLLALLVPVLLAARKAVIFGYLPFLTGFIALNVKQQCQMKEPHTIALLPPCKTCEKHIRPIEIIQNKVLITPRSTETIFDYHLASKQPTWQQQILKEIQLNWELLTAPKPTTEIQGASQPTEALAIPGMDTALRRDAKPLSNQLAISTMCWQAINQVSNLLNEIKASEMKSVASELEIPRYRNMNKTQLLLTITEAFDNAPAFSQ